MREICPWVHWPGSRGRDPQVHSVGRLWVVEPTINGYNLKCQTVTLCSNLGRSLKIGWLRMDHGAVAAPSLLLVRVVGLGLCGTRCDNEWQETERQKIPSLPRLGSVGAGRQRLGLTMVASSLARRSSMRTALRWTCDQAAGWGGTWGLRRHSSTRWRAWVASWRLGDDSGLQRRW
jgi:hypothetical protein